MLEFNQFILSFHSFFQEQERELDHDGVSERLRDDVLCQNISFNNSFISLYLA